SHYPMQTNVIRMAGQHDPALATKLTESVVDQPPDIDPKSSYPRYSERALLQEQLAISFAQQDPKRAVRAAAPLIEKGNIYKLAFVLSIIKIRDARAANELFIQVLAKAKLGQPSFEDIQAMAMYLFPYFGQGVIRFSSAASASSPYAHIPLDIGVIEQFLDLAYTVVTRRFDAPMTNSEGVRLNARSPLDYTLPKLLAPYFDRYMPDRAAAFRARVEEAARRVPPEEQQYLLMSEPGTVQELVTRADAFADTQAKDSLYDRAIALATLAGDFDQASAIINKMSDGLSRTNAQQNLNIRVDQKRDREAGDALERGDFDRVEALIAEVSNPRQRFMFLGSLIGQINRSKDKARAIRLLDEAKQQAARVENGIERTQQLMTLAGIATDIDENRGFEEIELAIKEFNRAGFVPELDKYQEVEAAGGKKPVKINTGLNTLLNVREFQWFGSRDFDRTLMLAQQFQMKEASAIAQLAACRGALAKFQSMTPRKPLARDADKPKQPKQSN
ncbi:MAG TPA: hypothetical protein VJX74_08185, partial [Blastocatellia bacterium]|nr:hypothetical protein [Blastocatellia bacterium]